ncbi:hypothetical protein V7024_16090 [Bacillus sp. JJ864]|uniref:hypothetical protein n=1 Tax=Bacillus TaxID=1386 RepID=UPI000279F9CC|nr:hypothetical protein [Bacillus wiedmannii]EJR09008.1 hypothetical protein II9_05608 [Bacillus cereus MSX-D12]PFZ35173.1 hypothetical protein COL77_30025 [Bacillus wiedmannii]PGM76353.1 hypothetical protein CN957_23555 [Bacillus cereus]
MNAIKGYLNSKDFIDLLSQNGFEIKHANFSKMKKKNQLPPPDILLGTTSQTAGWKEETVMAYIETLITIREKMKKNNIDIKEVNRLGNWFSN